METAPSSQHLKVNLKLAGKPCHICQTPLELAAEAAVCTACHGEYHARCWEARGGCATPMCMNAPLARFDATAARPLPPGHMCCHNCKHEIPDSALLCPWCGVITSPDGIYHGPKTNAPGAVASLVWGIVGLFICGVVFGPIAIARASSAKKAMASNPTYGGGGYATAGMVLGIIDLVAFALIVMARAGAQ